MKHIYFCNFPFSSSGVLWTSLSTFFLGKPHHLRFLYFSVPLLNNRMGLCWGVAYGIRVEFHFGYLLILFLPLLYDIMIVR